MRPAGAAAAAAGIGAIVLGPAWLLGFALAASVVAAGELFRLARAHGVRPAALVGHAAIATLVVAAYLRGEEAPVVFPGVIAAATGLAFVAALARADRRGATRGIASTILPVLAVGLLAAYVIAIRGAERHGFRLALVLVLMALAGEAGAAAAARLRPGLPAWLRPVAGGVATVAVGAVARATLSPPFSWPTAVLLALVVAVAAPLGARGLAMVRLDLAADREGSPGATGAFDAVLAAAPAYFYAFRLLVR